MADGYMYLVSTRHFPSAQWSNKTFELIAGGVLCSVYWVNYMWFMPVADLSTCKLTPPPPPPQVLSKEFAASDNSESLGRMTLGSCFNPWKNTLFTSITE